jgi:hypothetical protein
MSAIQKGVVRIEAIVREYDVWLDQSFPMAKMKVKILDLGNNDYLAVTNLRIRDNSGYADGEAGMGNTPEEAFSDLLRRFMSTAEERKPSTGFEESHFEWSAPEDF